MTNTLAVARKELRTWFQSPVALIFLGVFLLLTVAGFFNYGHFFARNIADLRPLFRMLPVLLIFLVSAITMRQWADERRSGTLEVLLTLPLRTPELVLGKFLAGMLLVTLALALTLPLPLTVAQLGDLDWGPVVGGYVGALLLASTYLALGLCVSARTDNQVVSLMVTLVLGGLLYLLGTPLVTGLLGGAGSELLRALGTGSRFESIERGVIDLRDLLYYLSLTGFFLVLNGVFLELDRVDPSSPDGRRRRSTLLLGTALVAANALALNLWLAPLTSLRVDLTENGEYSISRVTKETLAGLDEPLTILGLFSERTHPLLAPLVPQLRDLLAEYEIYGKGKVHVRVVDPNSDEELEQEINQQYGIHSVPFRVTEANQEAVVNSYFHVLVKYGDQYEVLSFDDLIEVDASGDHLDVRLRNPEYDITRAIRKVTQEFQSLDSMLASLPEPAHLTFYWSGLPGPDGKAPDLELPDDLLKTAETVEKVGKELAEESKGQLVFDERNPSLDPELASRLDELGVRPYALDLFAQKTFYFHLLLDAGGEKELIHPQAGDSEADLKNAIEAGLERATPGQLESIALVTERPEAPPRDPRLPPQFQPPTPEPDYQLLERVLGADYEVQRLDLEDGHVPETVDVLVVAKPGKLDEKQRFAIDQFLMRGGSVVALAGSYTIQADRTGLRAEKMDRSFLDLLSDWGVDVDATMVMDPQNAPFPIPVQERRGPFVMRRIELLPYPFFPDIRQDGFAPGHPALAGVPNVTVPWSSPLRVKDGLEGVQAETLLQTSEGSWLNTTGSIDPDFDQWPEKGFGPTGEQKRRVVAVALTGSFQSAFKGKASPLKGDADWAGQVLEQSPPDTRLVVVGSNELVSDLMLSLSRQVTGEVHRGNLLFLQNLLDWSVEDTDLLSIRAPGAFARTLRPLSDEARRNWQVGNYAVVLLALLAVALLPRRRRVEPIPLDGRAER